MRNVETLVLFRDPFELAYCEGTELVDPDNYRFNRLNAASVLLLEEGHCLRDHAIEACRIRSTEAVSPFAASSLLTLVEMVDADLGITYLPRLASGSALLSGTRVKTTPLTDRAYRDIGLGWRRGSSRADEFAALGEFIRSFHEQSSAHKA
jgi:LysR family hydrogen peroxide-inducible transcriptional activator